MPPMTADAAFIRAVVAAPDDDLPREIYADWLDEHGESERAEFIRVGCELARIPQTYQTCDCRIRRDRLVKQCWWCTLRNRESRLRSICWPAIRSTLPPPHDQTAGWEHWRPARGFIFRVSLQLAEWLEVGPDVVGCQPVERVTLSDRRPDHSRGPNEWYWFGPRMQPVDDSNLPDDIFRRLGHNAVYASYPTEAAALADLSAAAIQFARAEHNRRLAAAGLLPVPWGGVREGVGT